TSFVETTIEMANRETGQGQVTPTYNFGAHAGIVEVDTRTGRIKIIDYVAAHDIGTALNPLLVEGQIAGGVAMGLGSALSEEVIFEQGKMVNPSYMHYAL